MATNMHLCNLFNFKKKCCSCRALWKTGSNKCKGGGCCNITNLLNIVAASRYTIFVHILDIVPLSNIQLFVITAFIKL